MSKPLELDYDPDQFSDANTYGYGSAGAVSPTSSSGGGSGFSVGGTLSLPYRPMPATPTPVVNPTYANPTGSPAFSYEGMSILYQLGQALQPWQALLDRSTLAVNAGVSLGPGQKEPEIKVSPSADLHIPDWVWLVGGLGVAGLVLVVAARRKE